MTTRNEYIAQASMLIFIHKKIGNYPVSAHYAVLDARELVEELELKGCAPWQDTPKPAVELDGIDVHPIRKEITEADIYLGAKFSASPSGKIRYHVHGMPTNDEQIVSFSYHSYKGDQHQDSAVLSDFVRMLNTIGARAI